MLEIDSDTQVVLSLASHPGRFGMRFHNYLYDQLNLNFIYKSVAITDLKSAIEGISALGFRGASITMPFKEEVKKYLDSLAPCAKKIGAVNTILNHENGLIGYNTDYKAVLESLMLYQVNVKNSFCILGSGGMARAVAEAAKECGIENLTLCSRNLRTGKELCERYQAKYVDWDKRFDLTCDVVVNATPIGMFGKPYDVEGTYSQGLISNASLIVECVVSETPLVRYAKARNIDVVKGIEIAILQGKYQFELYTGESLSEALLNQVKLYLESKRLIQSDHASRKQTPGQGVDTQV